MNSVREAMLLYAVTDRAWTGRQTLLEQVECALQGGVTCVQLREKGLDTESFLVEAHGVKALCQRYGVPLIINDNVQVALSCGADGIHVGQSDMEADRVRRLASDRMLLGVSVQTVEQAKQAERNGADYLGVGAVFTTSTKSDADSVSLITLGDICKAVSLPVVAIGGIDKDNMAKLSITGVDGVAVVSAIFSSKDIQAECRELRILAQKMFRTRE